jgi:hypothetical protein
MKIIKTENGELINFANIIEINLVEGEGKNEDGKETTIFGVVAIDIIGKTHDLALYEAINNAENAIIDIFEWVELGKFDVFEMPE